MIGTVWNTSTLVTPIVLCTWLPQICPWIYQVHWYLHLTCLQFSELDADCTTLAPGCTTHAPGCTWLKQTVIWSCQTCTWLKQTITWSCQTCTWSHLSPGCTSLLGVVKRGVRIRPLGWSIYSRCWCNSCSKTWKWPTRQKTRGCW